jgi:hypothetical protein
VAVGFGLKVQMPPIPNRRCSAGNKRVHTYKTFPFQVTVLSEPRPFRDGTALHPKRLRNFFATGSWSQREICFATNRRDRC